MKKHTFMFASGDGYPPIDTVTRPTMKTDEAAFYLNRRPQTLRIWACRGGPITPININGRLAWRTDDVKRLVGFI